ncbi:MAG TPA: hypothetical protein VMT52_13185 [Planctomycetota bacterium]|nr:hypothetical protein [Planctomycetota bacterium]
MEQNDSALEPPASMMPGKRLLRAGLAASFFTAGCAVFESPSRDYVSNERVLEAIQLASGHSVDPSLFRLVEANVREDSVSFQYQGVRYVGDHAWVVRFSEKSTEQDPIALADVYSLLPLIKEGRTGFRTDGEGEATVGDSVARFVRYRFDSPVRDEMGNAIPGRGIVAVLRVSSRGGDVIYQVKLDNHGDRDTLEWGDLAPFVSAARGD